MSDQGSLILHFEGDIVENHQISARTLGNSLVHSQGAINRAYLDLKHGNLWKFARLKGEDYPLTEFIAEYPREGGFIQEVSSKIGKDIIDRIQIALKPAYEHVENQGEIEAGISDEDVQNIRNRLDRGETKPETYDHLVNNPDAKATRRYGDRSINREVDQLLSVIRHDSAGESYLEISTDGSGRSDFQFDRMKSEKFHSIISRRQLGAPVVYTVSIVQLARDKLTGKCLNASNDRAFNLTFLDEHDFLEVHPYLASREKIDFIGSPIIEYNAFDPNAGDVYFLRLA